MDAGDVVLKDHFSTAARNARYHSPTVQNELVAACGEWIQEKILQEVRKAKYFSVCAGEAADASNKEQLPLVLQFVDEAVAIREEFVEFILCKSGTTGKALARTITSTLERFALDLSYLRGQGYDGDGNMAAIIQDSYPKATYAHCAAHTLNLCVVSACSIPAIRNTLGVLQEICIFFNYSPKRQADS